MISLPATAPAAPYDYGYGRAYDASKTYYQQAGAPTGYTTPQNFDTANAAKVLTGFQAATSYAPARATIQQPAKPAQFTTQTYVAPTTYSATATTANTAAKRMNFYFTIDNIKLITFSPLNSCCKHYCLFKL
jgi:hypothetical protein